ncbi:MAG: ATP-binding cassette domain-containing protein [Desulfuromonadales bacterium]|nr:ATP-binding cassette domain-containing protein [Desulfuromonadales bacterium]
MTSALLEADRVSLSRPGELGMQPVLNDLSLTVAAGELVAVVGPSGGGKSSLLRLFNRLLDADSGTVRFAGEDIRSLAPPQLRARAVLVAQKPLLFAGTVRDNLAMPARLRRSTDTRSPLADEELLALCQLDKTLLDRDGQRLSIGQQQRVCLARAMAGPCQALLLDEPTSALDWPTAEALTRTFRDLARQRQLAILLVTHDLRVARLCADRLLVLIDGRIVEAGPVEEVIAAPKSAEARAFLNHPGTDGAGGDR